MAGSEKVALLSTNLKFGTLTGLVIVSIIYPGVSVSGCIIGHDRVWILIKLRADKQGLMCFNHCTFGLSSKKKERRSKWWFSGNLGCAG